MICNNEDLRKYLDILEKAGYKYIIKVNDKMLSGWGCARGSHVQLIACVDLNDYYFIKNDVLNYNSFNYFNYWLINYKKAIIQATYGKSYTIRNDWSRCYRNDETKKKVKKAIKKVNKLLEEV